MELNLIVKKKYKVGRFEVNIFMEKSKSKEEINKINKINKIEK